MRPQFVPDLRKVCVTLRIAQESRHSATTRHEGYALSIRHRKRIEEAFGWAKTVDGMAQTVYQAADWCDPALPVARRMRPKTGDERKLRSRQRSQQISQLTRPTGNRSNCTTNSAAYQTGATRDANRLI